MSPSEYDQYQPVLLNLAVNEEVNDLPLLFLAQVAQGDFLLSLQNLLNRIHDIRDFSDPYRGVVRDYFSQ